MASAAFSRPPLAYRVSAAARDNPLVRDLYDDDEIEDVTPPPQADKLAGPSHNNFAKPAPNLNLKAPPRHAAAYSNGEEKRNFTMEPEFTDSQQFKKVPAGGLNRSRPPQVLYNLTAEVRGHKEPLEDVPRVAGTANCQVEGLASIGIVLMQAHGKAPVVADLTPKGLEMSDVANYVRTGDRIVEVGERSVPWSMPVADVEKLLVGAVGSAVKVRLLRPFPISDGYGRKQMRDRKPENEECEEGVMYYINAVRWCPYLGQGGQWSEEDKQAILARPPPTRSPLSEQNVYIPPPLVAPQHATRGGLVYTKGNGFGLPPGSGWEIRHPVESSAGVSDAVAPAEASTRRGDTVPKSLAGGKFVKVDVVINQNFEATLSGGGAVEVFTQQLLGDISLALCVNPDRVSCLGLQAGSIRAQIAVRGDAQRSAARLGEELVAQALDAHSQLRRLQPHITSARLWLDSSVDDEDEMAMEAQEEARMGFLAHGAQGRGRTGDSIQAIEEQQRMVRERYAAIEAGKQQSLPDDMARSVASIVQGHVDDLEAHKLRPHKGMAAIDLRHELDRLEQRNAVMVQTCLGLYHQMTTGGKNSLVESLKRQIADAEAAHAHHDQLYKDGMKSLQDKLKESQAMLMAKSKEAMQLRTAYDVETTKLRHEKQAMEVRMQAQIDALTTKLEQDNEFQKLRSDIDKLLVLQTSAAAAADDAGGPETVAHLQAQIKKAHATRLEKGAGAHTEAEKQRMAVGGLVTEVEVLSLTNAQLVLDLHRLRTERIHFENLSVTLKAECERLGRELDNTMPAYLTLKNKCAELEKQVKALTTELMQRKHLKTPAGKWVAMSMQASKEELEQDLMLRREEFEEWLEKRRHELEESFRYREQELLDRIDERERLLAAVREELRAEIVLKEQTITEVALLKSGQHIQEEKWNNEISTVRSELELARRSISDLEAQVSLDAEEYRKGLAMLQSDLEISSDTLRAALAEAKGQVATAKDRLQRSQLQLAEKNTILNRTTQQIVALETQLQDANNKLLLQSMETGCLACRRAKLSGPPRQ